MGLFRNRAGSAAENTAGEPQAPLAPSKRLAGEPVAEVGRRLTASEVAHINGLERARADFSLAGQALVSLATDERLPADVRMRLFGQEEALCDVTAALSGDIGLFYGRHPGTGMSPLSADFTRRDRERRMLAPLGRSQLLLLAVARLGSGSDALEALAVTAGVDEAARAVYEERAARMSELAMRVERMAPRLDEAVEAFTLA